MSKIKVRKKKLEIETKREKNKKEMIWYCTWLRNSGEAVGFLNGNNLSPEDCHVAIDNNGRFWVFWHGEKLT